MRWRIFSPPFRTTPRYDVHIHLRRSRNLPRLFVRLYVCQSVCLSVASINSFWLAISTVVFMSTRIMYNYYVDCGHNKRIVLLTQLCYHAMQINAIVTIMKVYIERNNLKLELIQYSKNNVDFIHVHFCKATDLRTKRIAGSFEQEPHRLRSRQSRPTRGCE